jgi:hypothetical protein
VSDYDKDKKIHELEATIDSQHLMLEQYAKFYILSKADRKNTPRASSAFLRYARICFQLRSMRIRQANTKTL